MIDLDPRWQWVELRRVGDPESQWVKGPYLHTDVVPVDSGGQTVAHLCLTCDQQLPQEWSR